MKVMTLFPESKAVEIAAHNNAGEEEGWTYTVAQVGKYFVVEVRDEEGVLLGAL